MLDLCIANCKLDLNDKRLFLGIDQGKIVSIKKSPITAGEIIDVNGKLVLPGLIDAHVHFRDPGLTYKESFRTGSAAAAAGGFTTVLDMPNTVPPTNTPEAFCQKVKIGESKSLVDFGVHAGVSDLSFVDELNRLRPASFKIFMDLMSDDDLSEAFCKINGVSGNPLISLHAEDQQVVGECTEKMKKKGSDPELYALARPPHAEIESVKTAISLAGKIKQKIHFCHVSTRQSLELIKNAQTGGLQVTCEITPHHIFLDSSYFHKFGNKTKTNPPLRDQSSRLDLSYLPKIDIIGTDHAPHTLEEKAENVWNAPPGIPGIETILPLLLTQLNLGKISVTEIKRLLCENPANIFQIPAKGYIKEGMDADLVVVDLEKESIIQPENFKSKAKYTPFEGFKVSGMPVMTMVRGVLVMDNGDILKNRGQFIYNDTVKLR